MQTGKRILIFLLVLSLALFAAGCGSRQSNAGSEKLKVVTTIYPVYEFVRQVGGDKVDAVMLVNPGAEPHDWEPTAKELAQIKTAKVFFYHGAGLEPVDKLLAPEILGSAKAVEISKGVKLLAAKEDEHEQEHEHGHEEKHEHEHEHEHIDAHTWLDPVRAQQEVALIAGALADADPQNRDAYLTNAEKFNGELAKLDQDYQAALRNVARRDIVTSHAAFGYLAERYGLRQLSVMGLSPDSEPTPDKMAQIVEFCRENNVKYIFFETLVSPKVSETIAKETGAGLLVLNPIESLTAEETKQGKNYLSIMKENLEHLKKALND